MFNEISRRAGGTVAAIAGSALWAVSAFANVTAHVVTEAEKDLHQLSVGDCHQPCNAHVPDLPRRAP